MEFALVVSMIVLLLGGIMVFGRLFSYQLTLNNAAREGARLAAVCTPDPTVVDSVKKDAAHLPDVNTRLQVSINPPQTDTVNHVAPNPVTVTVVYKDYLPVSLPGISFGTRDLVAKYKMTLECPAPGGSTAGSGTGSGGTGGTTSGNDSGGTTSGEDSSNTTNSSEDSTTTNSSE